MDDCISRHGAIDALMAWEEDSVWDDECLKHRGEPYWVAPSDVIERLPSAQSERKKGKWIDPSNNGVWRYDQKAYAECSVCGKKQFLGYRMNYCPNCGADMRGEEE